MEQGRARLDRARHQVECVIEGGARQRGRVQGRRANHRRRQRRAFIVVNSDVLCTYPLRDLLHTRKHAREYGVNNAVHRQALKEYGVVVIDERSTSATLSTSRRPM